MSPEELIEQALEIQPQAYAPYSGFRVGAALWTESGQCFRGCNVENASFGLTCCAERNAVFAMIAAGFQRIQALAVVAPGGASMCGACRQVVAEFGPHCQVYLADSENYASTKGFRATTLEELLPGAFLGKGISRDG